MPEGPRILKPPASAPQPLSPDAQPGPTQVGGPPVLRLLESFVDVLPCGAVLVSDNTVRLNRTAEVMLGCAPGQLRTLDEWFAHLYGSDGSQHHRRYKQARITGSGWKPMSIIVPRGGDRSRQLELGEFHFDGVCDVWTLHDQTLRRDAEQRATLRDEDLRAVVDTATDAIVTIDEHSAIRSFNRAAERMFGYPAAEILGANVKVLMPEPHADAHAGYVRRYLETGETRVIGRGREVLARRKDGTTFPADLAVSEVDHRKWFTAIIRDLTARRDLERRLAESRLVARRNLARELHDGMGGTMAGIGMLAATLATQLHRADSSLASRADELVSAIDDANQELRGVTRGLLPVEVVPEGLMEALRHLVDATESTHGLACRLECDAPVYVHDTTVASQLFRIAQEAVTNVVRHARAKHLTVALRREADSVTLEVEDDGVGFQGNPDGHQGLGLVSMEQRCAQLGGQWSIEPRDESGTVVTCTVPSPPGDDVTRTPLGV